MGIFLQDSELFIGYAGICNISNTNQCGEYFIFIGDKTQWGKGIGTIVTKQILAYGFQELNLNRIMLTASAPNIGGIRAYEKAGFKKEGIMRNACFRDGQFHDKIVMSILRDEWK
jgi:RimJ/RimL family protein N-acetyltransferase